MDSKMPDAQAAHEFTLTAILPALAGANMIYGVGMLDSGMTWDYAQAVMQNEMVSMIVKAIKGISLNDELLALDVIESVAPGGEYITHAHTYENMKQQSQVDLFDRNTREAWEAGGSNDIVDKSYEKALYILENYKPDPLPDDILTLLNEQFNEAEIRAEKQA
ncbi:MAG: trimethylamine methyltransferase family protein [Deltaproteobacteria bacterium]|nr:trimethylamine methyltransferase family protein [Deltaproteobacteria bacterium]